MSRLLIQVPFTSQWDHKYLIYEVALELISLTRLIYGELSVGHLRQYLWFPTHHK